MADRGLLQAAGSWSVAACCAVRSCCASCCAARSCCAAASRSASWPPWLSASPFDAATAAEEADDAPADHEAA